MNLVAVLTCSRKIPILRNILQIKIQKINHIYNKSPILSMLNTFFNILHLALNIKLFKGRLGSHLDSFYEVATDI